MHAPGCEILMENGVDLENPTPKCRIWCGSLNVRKTYIHINNSLDAKITATLVYNGERGFHIHILWLYNSAISQSYRGFTDFGGICSGICTPTKYRERGNLDFKGD